MSNSPPIIQCLTLVIFAISTPVLHASAANALETHDHPAPERLGQISFPVSCNPAVQPTFDRGVALLHSFAYSAARTVFQDVVREDPKCAMAHWGVAMTYFHQLWEPPLSPEAVQAGQPEVDAARKVGTTSDREGGFIEALAQVYDNAETIPFPTRVRSYERSMADLYSKHGSDTEVAVFYALALLANASPADKLHSRQKQAAEVLEPLYRKFPEHPGIAHYLIHAYDSTELAPKGLTAGRAYSRIAPSAPHALHMPSHIFTRLGLWQDSISSNLAARDAARRQGDIGEELHAMDYLMYAYLQEGRDADAKQLLQDLRDLSVARVKDFKAGYASTAMPVRYAVERGAWKEASDVPVPSGAPPEVVAVAVWARGVGKARLGHAADAMVEADRLQKMRDELLAEDKAYWASQTSIQLSEVKAWAALADHRSEEAAKWMREAADAEDALEKLPMTPGPIVPAREQLGDLLLEQNQAVAALAAFQQSLVTAPGRRGAIEGMTRARQAPARESR